MQLCCIGAEGCVEYVFKVDLKRLLDKNHNLLSKMNSETSQDHSINSPEHKTIQSCQNIIFLNILIYHHIYAHEHTHYYI